VGASSCHDGQWHGQGSWGFVTSRGTVVAPRAGVLSAPRPPRRWAGYGPVRPARAPPPAASSTFARVCRGVRSTTSPIPAHRPASPEPTWEMPPFRAGCPRPQIVDGRIPATRRETRGTRGTRRVTSTVGGADHEHGRGARFFLFPDGGSPWAGGFGLVDRRASNVGAEATRLMIVRGVPAAPRLRCGRAWMGRPAIPLSGGCPRTNPALVQEGVSVCWIRGHHPPRL